MASLVKDLVEAGIHFGHRSNHWNPRMSPYIFGRRNRIHIIDVRETIKGLLLARKYLTKMVAEGKDVLFVGTKRQARSCIEQHAREVGMHWVTERWLGGTLTNFRTIRERLKRLEELERLDESGEINSYSKKMESTLRREQHKIKRNLDGIRNMTRLPGALVVIDVKHEANAIKEARKLGIPTVSLIDTDSDPDQVDIAIPGNDDAMKSIDIVIKSLAAAVMEGKSQQHRDAAGRDKTASERETPPKRSSRAMFRADESAVATSESQDSVPGEAADAAAAPAQRPTRSPGGQDPTATDPAQTAPTEPTAPNADVAQQA